MITITYFLYISRIFTWISVDHKEKYDSSFYAKLVATQTGNLFAGMLSKSILDGNDIFGLK